MMRRWRFIAGLAWRESRTARRRLLLFMSSISLGVGALVAIDSTADNVRSAVRSQARGVMGGDVTFSSDNRFPDSIRALIDSIGAAGEVTVGTSVTFTSMAYAARTQNTRLSQVRAVPARSDRQSRPGSPSAAPGGAPAPWARRTRRLVT